MRQCLLVDALDAIGRERLNGAIGLSVVGLRRYFLREQLNSTDRLGRICKALAQELRDMFTEQLQCLRSDDTMFRFEMQIPACALGA